MNDGPVEDEMRMDGPGRVLMHTFSMATTGSGCIPFELLLQGSLMQAEVVQDEWQWAVSEESKEENEWSKWRKAGVSSPARLREPSSTKLILMMGMLTRGDCG